MYETFIKDNIRQLKCGMECYVFKDEQVEIIKNLYIKETNLDLKIENKKDFILIKPTRKFLKNRSY